MSTRIGDGSPTIPQQVTPPDVEDVKQTETKPADATTPADTAPATPAPSAGKAQAGKLAEFALTGMTRAAELLKLTGAGTPPTPDAAKLPTDTVLKRNDNQKEPDDSVAELQKQVNGWRTENGKKPIKEDGFYGPKTENAVLEFQKAQGLQKDGQAGIQTQNRALLENDPGFKQLDPGIKDQVRSTMSDYKKDSDKINNLRDFATAPGLSKLPAGDQQKMLDMQKANADDAKFTSQLKDLANDGTFRALGNDTRADVLDQVNKYAGDPGKIDNLTKMVTSPSFDQLSRAEQKRMMDTLAKTPDDANLAQSLGKLASHPGYKGASDAVKSQIVDTFASSPPVTNERFNSTMGLVSSAGFRRLSAADQATVMDGLKAGNASVPYADNMKKLLGDPKFQSLKEPERTAVLAQVKNYPDARSVNNIDRMLQKDWFQKQDLADKQRSLKTVAYLSQYGRGDRAVIDNTLEKFVGEKSDFQLVWKNYKKDGKGITFGEGDDKTLWLNRGIIAADNNKLVENGDTRHLVLATVPHEVNHLMNGDKVDSTYKYFEAEYRAWYVGFKAEHGRPPTNQEAMQQRIAWQLNKDSFYGPYAADALKKPKEAAKFYDLLSKMSGQKVDAGNWNTVIKSDASKWAKPNDPAPVPAGNLDNH